MKKVEDIENRRAGKIKEQDVEEIPADTEDDKDIELQATQANDSVIVHQEASVQDEDNEDGDSGFALWLRSISQCLSNKISDDPVVMPAEEEEESDEDLDEDTRCMRYVLLSYLARGAGHFTKTFQGCPKCV